MELLGKITIANGIAQNNLTTAVPFRIPPWVRKIYLQSDTDGVQFEIGVTDAFQTTAARGALLPAANLPEGPFNAGIADGDATTPEYPFGNTVPRGGTSAKQGGASRTAPAVPSAVLSIFNPTAGTANVLVYAAPA